MPPADSGRGGRLSLAPLTLVALAPPDLVPGSTSRLLAGAGLFLMLAVLLAATAYVLRRQLARRHAPRDEPQRLRPEDEEALRDSERRLQTIIETEPECVKVVGRDGRLLEINAAGLAMLEAGSLKEAQQRPLLDYLLPEHRVAFDGLHERVLQGESGQLDYEIRGLKGTRRWLETHTAPLRDATGEVTASLGITRDITEQKHLEKERETERSTLELMAGGASLPALLTHLARGYEERYPEILCSVLLLDADGKRLRHGAAPSLPVEYCEAIDGLEIGPVACSCGTAAFTGQTTIVVDIAKDPLWRDGKDLALAHGLAACWSVPILSAQGRVLGTFALYYRAPRAAQPEEVTAVERGAHLASLAIERKRTEEALRESEDRHRDLVENSQDLVCTHDLEGRVLSSNEAASRLSGYPLQAIVGRRISDLVAPRKRHLFEAYLKEIEATGRARGTMEIRAANGETRYWEFHNTLRTEGVAVPLVRGSGHDVTEEVLAKRALKRSERRYRDLFELSLAGVYRSTLDGRILDCNEAFARIYGYASREEAMQRAAVDFHPNPEARRQYLAELKIQGTLVNHESRGHTRDGRLIWLLENARLLAGGEGGAARILGTLVDITDRKRAHETMRLQSAALNATSSSIVITDREGAIVWTNPAFTELSGYRAEEARGKNHRDLVKSGVHDRAFYEEMWDTLLDGRSWRGEVTNRRKDLTLYTEEQAITPVKDAHGEITHFISMKRDLTEEKRLEAQFLQAQKMETVGQLAGGVAHDFNNLLTVITGTAELAASRLRAGDPLHRELREIREAGERAAALTHQLLAFSRKQVMKPDVLNLSKLVANMQDMLARLIGESIELVVGPVMDAGSVLADPGQMEQVVMNLVVNARDAMPAGGRLTIGTRSVDLDDGGLVVHPLLQAGPHLVLSVSDTGSGMGPETRARLFEPFYTTKDAGKGTGLGMATVYGIVRQSGGSISVDSELGRGTTFEIYLPQVEEAAEREDAPAVAVPLSGSHETILVVEDESGLRRLTTRILESAGYAVVAAGDGSEALGLLERHDGPVHLVLTDVVLPGISGPELATRIGKVRPEAKILFTSGYTDDAVLRHGVSKKGLQFIGKPFAVEELKSKVREVLDS